MENRDAREFDKIRILIVDDQPLGLCVNAPPGNNNPWMHKDYTDYFEFRWLATPEECRTFRDLTWALGECNLPLLIEKGWIPEILAVDYFLLDDTHPIEERMAAESRPLGEISPLPSLREAAEQAVLPRHVIFSDIIDEQVFSARFKDDLWGCFAGGLILASLSDHPCAPVAITRYRSDDLKKKSPDTWFFEWMMASQTGGMLKGKGLTSVTWKDIVEPGVGYLRERIKQLAKFGIITLNLDELSAIASSQDQPILTLQSRYGIRRLPVPGLFVDDPTRKPQWAEELLDQLIAVGTPHSLKMARYHAEQLLQKYDDEKLVYERIELSDLLLRKEKKTLRSDGEEAKRLNELISRFNATVRWEGGRANGEIQNVELIGDIRHIQVDDWTRKWTALCIIVLLLKRFCIAWNNGMPREKITEPEVYLALCPVARNPIILPFSEGSDRDIGANMLDVDRKVMFRIKKVLAGRDLDGAERVLLRHLAQTLGLDSHLSMEYPLVGRFLRGEGQP